VSGLPEGDPASHGQSLDPEIPGTNTYAKPVNDVRHDEPEPGSIYRKDGPGDLAKPQDGGGSGDDGTGDTRDHTEFKPTFNGPGGRPPDSPTVTDWPYRTDRKQKHYASAEFIAGLFLLRFAHEALFHPRLSVRVASTIDEITQGLDPAIEDRGTLCSVTIRRVDTANLRWLFSVNCGNGAKVVRVKAERIGNIVRLARMNLRISCSCPAWQWLGPEYHAKQKQYMDGRPVGTASPPDIRDPQREHQVCKHVAAVLSTIKKWEIPLAKSVGGAKSKSEEM
jgi:hypothetical protein